VTEAERAFAAVHLRARVAIAFAVLVFVGIAYQTDLAGPEIPSRAFAIGVALAVAAGIEELAARRARREIAATAGTVAEFFAFALAVALFARYTALAPAVLLWPIVFGAVTLRQAYLLYLAAMGTAIVVEIGVLRPGASPEDVIGGLAWGGLYFGAAAFAGSLGARYRRFQRRTESAYASIATITAATSYSELARMLFAYAERALDLPRDVPAALLFDDRGIGTLSAIDTNAIDPEQRARFRVSGEAIETLRGLGGKDGAFVSGAAIPVAANAPDALRTGRPFVLPLRDARRLVGFAIFASTRRRRRPTAELRADLERVAEQVATTAVRIRGGRAIEAQRLALAGVLEAHSAERAEMQVATWLARSARDIAIARDIAVLQDLPDGRCRAMYAIGVAALEVEQGSGSLVDEVRRRGVAVVITDGARERRIQLPPFLRTGATAIIPVRGQGTYLFVHEPQREGLTSGVLQLLVELCDQAATLLASAYASPTKGGPAPSIERRLAAVIAHTRGESPGDERDSRARIVDALRLAVEGNQPLLAGSGERIAGIASAIAERLDLDAAARDDLYVAALLRDVGELGIDRRVLETPGELTEDQRAVVRRHPMLGQTILAALAFLDGAARVVRAHHERWDGAGYPDQLAATEIPLGARILSVADAFVAMTSDRAYRAALRPAEAMGLLIAARGSSFDPNVVDAFVALNSSDALGVSGVPAR
jgi:HD-GYP domain-containing protein (c-di-GMP phosphodiesterase class II)